MVLWPNRKALAFIFATVFLDLLGAGILLPVIPFLVRPYRTDATTVGLLSLAFSAAQFVATPILGGLSDRHGRRPVLLLSILGSALGYGLFGIGGSLAVLYFSRLLDGFTGGNISTAQAFIADISAPEDRAKNFGLIGVAFGLGFMIGPAAGGALSQVSLQAPAWAACALATVTTVFGYFALPESLPPEKRRRDPMRARDFNPFLTIGQMFIRVGMAPLLLAVFAFNFANSGMQSNFAVFTNARWRFGPAETGWVLAMVGVMAGVTQGWLVRRLMPRYGERPLTLVGLACSAAGFVGIAAAPGIAPFLGATMLMTVGMSLAGPPLTSLLSRRVGPGEQGVLLGATMSVASLARMLGPYWAGVTFDHVGPGAPYYSGALWTAVGLALVASATTAAMAHAAGSNSRISPIQ